jgi:MarR family 2-MHQ and catechol resistance regulon transcriptional repressor
MYFREVSMSVSELLRLGRRLSDLALEGMGSGELGLTPSEFLVLQDLYLHGPTSIVDVVSRTGIAQSRVSTSVAGFVDRGWARTSRDPLDGRKTVVKVTESVRAQGEGRRARTAADALAPALAAAKPAERERLISAVERLHELLDGNADVRPAAGKRRTATGT